MAAEKRAHIRFPLSIDVALIWDGERYPAKSRDVSLGGMFVYSDAKPPLGTEVMLRFTLPGLREESVVKAIVRWPFVGGIGVAFKPLKANEVAALKQLVPKHK